MAGDDVNGVDGDGCVNGVVVFDPNEFRRLKPQFASLSDDVLKGYFAEAEMTVWGTAFENKPSSPIPCRVRKALLYALTCHLATLAQMGEQTGGMSGTVSSASEGSVSVSFSTMTPTGKAGQDWLSQTECGAFALMILKKRKASPRLYFGLRGCCPWR